MSVITYPLNETTYGAEDAAMYNFAISSGVATGDDFSCSVTGGDNIVTVSPGIGYINPNRFSGLVVGCREAQEIDLGLPDAVYQRIDVVALQFDVYKNATNIVVKKGTPAVSPAIPPRTTTETVYELYLCSVLRRPAALSVSASDVTDLRMNPEYCGLMANSVTSVDTTAISRQVAALIDDLRKEIAEIESGSGVELKKLAFHNVAASASDFIANSTYADSGYNFRIALSLGGVSGAMIPEVVFSVKDATSGNFAPVAETYGGGVYIYSATQPTEDIVIPTIICWRA
jgi:hypothetical protein